MTKTVTHLISGLGKGGAETLLFQILQHQINSEIKYRVISLGESHFFEDKIANLGIRVIEVSIRKRPLKSVLTIIKEMKGQDVLFCWMYQANLLGYYLGKIAKVEKIIWGIHHSDLSKELNKKTTLLFNRLCIKKSHKIDFIVYAGQKARTIHEDCGYSKENGIVINNGFDRECFSPNPEEKGEIREEYHIADKKRIFLSVTKDLPIKDIPNLINAFSLVKKSKKDVVAVLCGNGVSPDNSRICELCKKNDLIIGQDVFLLGLRNDVPRLMRGCDFFVMHSAGEAFPLTIVEAMACGCFCIATDVGDVKMILNQDAWIVPPSNELELARKMIQALKLSKEEVSLISEMNFKRAINNFDLMKVVQKYEEIECAQYEESLSGKKVLISKQEMK